MNYQYQEDSFHQRQLQYKVNNNNNKSYKDKYEDKN